MKKPKQTKKNKSVQNIQSSKVQQLFLDMSIIDEVYQSKKSLFDRLKYL